VAESYRQGEGAPKDVVRAGDFFGEACTRGLDVACEQLWMLFESDRRVRVGPALRAFEKECSNGQLSLRCPRVAWALEHGIGMARGRAKSSGGCATRVATGSSQPRARLV
jgi:TPR repeat protein